MYSTKKGVLFLISCVAIFLLIILINLIEGGGGSIKQDESINNIQDTTSATNIAKDPSEEVLADYNKRLQELHFYKPLYDISISTPTDRQKFQNVPDNIYSYHVNYQEIDESQYIANVGGSMDYKGKKSIKFSTPNPSLFLESYSSLLKDLFEPYSIVVKVEKVSSVNYNPIGDGEFESAYSVDSFTNRVEVYIITLNNYPLVSPRGVHYIKVNKNISTGLSIIELPRFFPVSASFSKLTNSLKTDGELHIVGYKDPKFITLMHSYKSNLDSDSFNITPQIMGLTYVLYTEDQTIIPVLSFVGYLSDPSVSNMLEYPNLYFGIF